MSTTSRRVLTVTVAAIIAVLTGVVVGLLSARASCNPGLEPKATAAPPGAPPTTTAASPQAGLGGSHAEPVRPSVAGTEPVAAERKPVCGSRDTFEALPALAAVGGAGLAGLAALVLMLAGATVAARRITPAPVAPPERSRSRSLAEASTGHAPPLRPGAPPPIPPVPPPVANRRTEADRAALVRACIYVRDRITSKALADRLGAALQEAGVNAVEPAGERFDPALHEAGGSTHSDDPSKVGTIAAVEVPGYSDRGRILRAPVVTVYQAAGTKPGTRHAEREDPQ
jgi:GrpE